MNRREGVPYMTLLPCSTVKYMEAINVSVDLVREIHREAILTHETFISPNSPCRTFEW